MTSFRKSVAVIVLGGSILGIWQLENRVGSFQEQPIAVSVETAPCKVRGRERIHIALKAEVNGTGLPHGSVVLHIRPVAETAARDPLHFLPIEGYTDHKGTFITNWGPPCPGDYVVSAEVSKSRCSCGRGEFHFTLNNQSWRKNTS
jgi:hypothetical protein